MYQPQVGTQFRPQQYQYGYYPYAVTPYQTDMTGIFSQMMPMIMMIMMMGIMFAMMRPMMAGLAK